MKAFLATLATVLALAFGPAATQAAEPVAEPVAGKLVLYTSQLEPDARQTVEAFKAKNPGVEVEWVRNGTTELMNKLRAEFAAGAPQPDLLLIADAVTMESLKAEKRLTAYPQAPVAGYRPGTHDPQGFWFATKLITTGIVYNTAAPMKPASWQDLLKPEAKGTTVMPSPLYSGAAAIHMAAVKAEPSLGMAYYEALQRNGTAAAKGNGGILKDVAGGTRLYGMIVDYLPIREQLKGAPVAFVFPKEGVSAVSEPVAMLSTARNPAAARAFIDFLLSREGQQLASAQGFLPALPGIAPPAGFPDPSTITLMPYDPAKALAEDDANKRAFADLFGG
ncbi:ABC transporter substrate-binding protein [Azospirillum picis]|uniref:Iron(III) transport system substrate-binding protein n=1 Tax=Azospirillum picis TaxID=488438 RepID=A0ABU0MNK3_9PROT|nr:ABC transporter substrate-binding protein [Azospirillum picis]MBP2303590.1 iron(III) transport system substrate-binding protein [Azospirillum picis]MDQ0534783.1 iron(III) transport system substrate-binding protein [Azospirillum picis]